MALRQLALAGVALLLLGCDSAGLASVGAALQVSAARLDFPDTFLGQGAVSTLELRTSSRAARTVDVQWEGPFAAAKARVEVPAGTAVELRVTFTPTAPGPAQGSLWLRSEGQTLQVALSGAGVAVPACPPGGACRAARFDPSVGACVEDLLPDATPCASACVADGRCAAGSCAGTAVSCDDGDACTADACSLAEGCVHPKVSCPASAGPCQVATCDARTGCGAADAPDGTPCGAMDCATAQVCLAGSCRTVAVPDGVACGAETPCQDRGVCRNQACEQPPEGPLREAWSYRAPAASSLNFEGAMDAAGNLYWTECTLLGVGPPCELVSSTRDGALRYRSPLLGTGARLLVADAVVVHLSSSNLVEAFRAGDGALAWRRDLLPELGAVLCDQFLPEAAELRTAAYNGATVVVGVNPSPSCFGDAEVVALDASTGQTSWKRSSLRVWSELVADEVGNFYAVVSLGDESLEFRLVSLAPTGEERWSVPAQAGGREQASSLAVFGGTLLEATHLRPTASGALVAQLGYAPELAQVPLLEASSSFVFQEAQGCVAEVGDYTAGLFLRRSDQATGALEWSQPVGAGQLSEPLLSARGSVVFASGDALSGAWRLREASAQGREAFSCALPGTYSRVDAPVLHAGRWLVATTSSGVTTLRAFEVPGLDVAPSGWVARGGSPARDGRPR